MSHFSSRFLNPNGFRIQDAKVCLQPTISVAGCTWQEICNSIGSDLMRVIRSNDCSTWLHNHPVDITEPGEPYIRKTEIIMYWWWYLHQWKILYNILSSQKVGYCDIFFMLKMFTSWKHHWNFWRRSRSRGLSFLNNSTKFHNIIILLGDAYAVCPWWKPN